MERTYVRHANESTFQPVEPGIFVRDLGVGALTNGELTAQVVRIDPEGAYVEKLHRHDEGFSLAYVLKCGRSSYTGIENWCMFCESFS